MLSLSFISVIFFFGYANSVCVLTTHTTTHTTTYTTTHTTTYTTTHATTLDYTVVKCKPEWTLYEGKCYRYNPQQLNHADAHNLCLSQGAVLMNIKKQADINFAVSLTLTNTDTWLGGSAISMFRYKLPDGSILDNKLFCKGEPNNDGGTSNFIRERCINRKSNEGICLNDGYCPVKKPSICEIGIENKDYVAAP